MDKSTENPGKKNGMFAKLRRSLRLQTRKNPHSPGGEEANVLRELPATAKNSDSVASPQPPSPGLNSGSASTSPNNNQKNEDDELDVSPHKSRPLTRSNTDPTTSTFDNTVKRVRESFYFRRKKDEDKPPSIEEKVTPTFEECLEGQYLFEATQQLIEREKHLFGEITEADALKDHEEAVEKLSADHEALEERIEQTVQQSLSLSSEKEVSALTSAVKAINLEEEQDQLWGQNSQTPPAWRPSEWKKHHDEVLQKLVSGRMDNPSSPIGDQVNQSSIEADIQSMGKQLKKDMEWVVEVVKNCYPPEMDICNFYARLYHQTFSARLKKIADLILEKPELASNINTEALGNLLPDDLLKPLEEHKAFIKANLSCVEQFRDFFVEHDLFPEDVKKKCLQVLTEMKQSAHTYLLTPVHKILKPHYQKLGTSDWLKKKTFEKLLNSTEDELQELQGSSQSSYQELIGQLHQEVTVEYVQRLLKGKVKLKNTKKQLKAYETVKENAEKLHELFARMVRLDL
ncbi:tumor necrosis factor alpha-induced protein 2-like [Neolamprologus brichardi]|uniref:tumor necrosis factor alpha-induced protein 2-like n=1 Tax=Neolamprologus brichardi TaxID=32507 RepID=UPI001643B4EB|nr:tumor necrosis factor alpha-induced protein 2-like [Neolamprologus brichardi]